MNYLNFQSFTKKTVLLVSFIVCVNYLNAQTSYTWIGGSSGVFTIEANWSPTRTTPSINDVLLFSSDATVTGVPTQTIGQLVLRGNATISLQALSGGSRVLTVGSSNILGDDISVPSGCTLILASNASGVNAETFSIGLANVPGVTANIAGTLTLEPNATTSASGAVDYALNTSYTLNQLVTNKGELYKVTTAGTTSALGKGPGIISGTVTDSTVVFTYTGTLFGSSYATAYNNAYDVHYGLTTITGTVNYAGKFNNPSLLTANPNTLQLIGATFNNQRFDAAFPGAGGATITNAPSYTNVNLTISGVQYLSGAQYISCFPSSINALNFNCPNLTNGSIRPQSFSDGSTTLNAVSVNINLGNGGAVMLPTISGSSRVNISGDLTVNTGQLNFGWSGAETVTVGGTLSLPSTGSIGANTTSADSLFVNNFSITGSGSYATINSGTTHMITVIGNFTKSSGAFNANSLIKIRFAGSTAQTLSNNGINKSNNLTIEIANSGVAGNNTVTSSRAFYTANLIMTSGVLVASPSNHLIVTGSVKGGNSNAYIAGNIYYATATTSAFTLPFGFNGQYLPLTITPSTATADTFNVTYNTTTPNLNKLTLPLTSVYNGGYYSIRLTSGTNNAIVAVGYGFPSGLVKSTADLVLAKYGTAWSAISSNPVLTGDVNTGVLADNTSLSLSTTATQLVIGSINSATALPIKLRYLIGKNVGNENQLNWESVTEGNLVSYQVERLSANGNIWESLGSENAKGNASTYQFIDKDLKSSLSIYRLKLIYKDASYTYSKNIEINTSIKKQVVAYPNPFGSSVTIDLGIKPNTPLSYRLLNMNGKCIQRGVIAEKVTLLPSGALPSGDYLLSLGDGRSSQLVK